jgi:hypothetical protein
VVLRLGFGDIVLRIISGDMVIKIFRNRALREIIRDMVSSSSSFVGDTARCGLWLIENYLSIFSCYSPTLSIFSLPALEDLFPLLLSIFSRVFLFVSSLPVLE